MKPQVFECREFLLVGHAIKDRMNGGTGFAAQVAKGAAFDDSTVSDDTEPVGQCLQFGEDVTAEQDGDAPLRGATWVACL